MTKSTITREQLLEIIETDHVQCGEASYLARMALAAMDSEPVAWVSSESLDSRLAGIEAVTIPFVPGMDIPLFRRPVVTHNGDCDTDPFGFARRSGGLVVIDVNGDPHIKDGMPLYRHAQTAPVAPVCTCPSGDGSLRWPCPVHAGKSPVIPDSARDALEKALAAMEFMGDTLNNLDAVCTEDVELVAPAFDAVRSVLAAAHQEVK